MTPDRADRTPHARLAALVARIEPVDDEARDRARRRHLDLATPPGALGHLEELGAHLSAIAGTCPPPIPRDPALVVAAGDHGVHARGVTRWPREVTALMVRTVAAERAAVSSLAAHVGVRVALLDVAVDDEAPAPDGVRRRRVVPAGTRDLVVEPAMTRDEAVRAILHGAELAEDLVDDGADLVATGDLGIANTTASAALVAAMTGAAPEEVVGPGAGNDDEAVARKVDVVAAALARHGRDRDPVGVVASVGGAEHAALMGVVLAGAARRVPVVLDGVIAGAAALVAAAIAPPSAGVLVAGHRSTEPGATRALDHLHLRPLLDLDLRLGEGSGAVLAIPLVQCAAALLAEVATLDEVLGGAPDPAGT